MNNLEKCKKFAFDTGILTDNHLKVVKEEFNEFLSGITENDIIEIFDGALDTIYTLYIYLLLKGFSADCIEEGFTIVCDNNLSKIKNGVIKNKDGKVIKPKDHVNCKILLTELLKKHNII